MNDLKRLPARFWQSEAGNMPVREWLLSLEEADRKAIGDDIRTAEFGWPIGMPVCRKITGHKGLWEIRTTLNGNRIARTFFTIEADTMVLLHGFIKKSQATPKHQIETAVRRQKGLKQ
ncbi:MAG: type II toxin-antitoxin system RelE/ParE family toxin [Pseudomonadota bacterium]